MIERYIPIMKPIILNATMIGLSFDIKFIETKLVKPKVKEVNPKTKGSEKYVDILSIPQNLGCVKKSWCRTVINKLAGIVY